MIRDNIKDFNLIESPDGETIIGFYEDIVRYNKEVAKDYIDKLDPTEYESVTEILELLQLLQEQYNIGSLCDENLIEVGYNPMGAFTFCKRVRESE